VRSSTAGATLLDEPHHRALRRPQAQPQVGHVPGHRRPGQCPEVGGQVFGPGDDVDRAEQRGRDGAQLVDPPVGADAAAVAGERTDAALHGPGEHRRVLAVLPVGQQDRVAHGVGVPVGETSSRAQPGADRGAAVRAQQADPLDGLGPGASVGPCGARVRVDLLRPVVTRDDRERHAVAQLGDRRRCGPPGRADLLAGHRPGAVHDDDLQGVGRSTAARRGEGDHGVDPCRAGRQVRVLVGVESEFGWDGELGLDGGPGRGQCLLLGQVDGKDGDGDVVRAARGERGRGERGGGRVRTAAPQRREGEGGQHVGVG
jgi:hypothetical protein